MSGSGAISPNVYQPRSAAVGPWEKIVRENLPALLEEARDENDPSRGVPAFVERELRAFLACAEMSEGFLRLRCADCKHSVFLPFTCGGRAACPSCAARRMAEVALPSPPWARRRRRRR